MKKELEIWQFAAETLKKNESVMLLIVAESAGSSPGRRGFKMAVAADKMRGSIGGGAMEVELVKTARVLLDAETRRRGDAEKNSFIRFQVHQKNAQNSSGMICSGRQTVVFYKLIPPDLPTINAIVCSLEKHQSKTLHVSPNEFCALENQSNDCDFKFGQKNENDFLYEEKLGFTNKLFIVGGGHCALALSELAARMDFYISLFDDRADLNTFEKNNFVHSKQIIKSYENIGDFIASGANHFVVVMTVGYKSDETVIRRLFDKDFKYFGVLGSRAKMKTLLKNLEREGFDEEKLNKIRAPIGLKINSRTPEEIAVSIAAEIIGVKNAGD
ncbi:MAG TPA: XdhC family protein [Pyrinomonadaceae bacterium]|nr:XdhC family protein [Pyrinomonadaceae bacterium]